ncbi:MAG: DNA cytosine methyltransferase [Candidatus Nanoarchaeia archaeon]|jgi:DNA (cytosine-5)-methyltransferase 1
MKIASLFSGCGGLDLGFKEAGFDIIYANDNAKWVWETYEKNHKMKIDKRSITEVASEDIPKVIGIIGGPPCQSWSLAGAMRGIKDPRGKLFYEYIRILKDKRPLFFLAENVPGIISKKHKSEFLKIIKELEKLDYLVSYKLVNSKDYSVPEERKRVIIVGYHKSLGKRFVFPEKNNKKVSLKEAIGDLPEAKPAADKNKHREDLSIPNHEYLTGSFSTIYMSRNRKRNWDEQSFTIQAGARHAPLHPSSCDMIKIGVDKMKFVGEKYRRLSVRECAKIQTFPDDFIFYYKNVPDGYKMIGNAVPVLLSKEIAKKIKADLKEIKK